MKPKAHTEERTNRPRRPTPPGIERRGGEDAAEDDADETADAVDAPDVERVVPSELVLQRHGVEADDARDDADQAGGGWGET